MAENKENWVRTQTTTNGLGGLRQDLNTGLQYDADGNAVIPDIVVPQGQTVVQTDQIGAFRRTVFSDGSVETIQTLPANQGDGSIVTPVPLPGESQDVTGTGQDAAYKPKTAPSSKKS